jgi:hypothetical protein
MPTLSIQETVALKHRMRRTRLDLCWEWSGSRLKSGYGEVTVKGKKYLAHRLAWFIFCKEDPKGLFVCHTCDNPSCCNPDHLFLGTAADNSADMVAKGRSPRTSMPGEANPRAVISDQDVSLIRSSDLATKELAVKFGVTEHHIRGIRRGVYRKASLHSGEFL